MQVESRFKAAAAVVFVIMLSVAAAPVRTSTSLGDTEVALNRSIEREHRLGQLLDLLRDAETAQRGFIITGNERFLGHYYASVAALPALRSALTNDHDGTPAGRKFVADTLGLADQKLDDMARTIALRREEGFAAVQPVVASGRGKQFMDELRGAIGGHLRVEAERRTQLQEKLRSDTDRMLYAGAAGTVLNLVLLSMLLWMMFRMLRDRKSVAAELRTTAEQLTSAVGDSEQRNHEMRLAAEMLQALGTIAAVRESAPILSSYCTKLFPGKPGILYLYRNSRDILEPLAAWGGLDLASAPVLDPGDCWALKRGQPHYTSSLDDLNCKHYDANKVVPGGRLCVPLVTQGEVIGLMHLEGVAPLGDVELQQLLVLTMVEQLALALSNVQLREKLRLQSIVDPLTGLFNRRFMDETLRRELVRAQRKQTPLSLVMIDLDHFKRLNDTFGHEAGDAVLKSVAQVMRANIRESDLACRFGGEELIVILPECDLHTAVERAEKIRLAIAALHVQHGGRMVGTVTASFGVAVSTEHGTEAASLVPAVDAALYEAKNTGRNRVVVAGASLPEAAPAA